MKDNLFNKKEQIFIEKQSSIYTVSMFIPFYHGVNTHEACLSELEQNFWPNK